MRFSYQSLHAHLQSWGLALTLLGLLYLFFRLATFRSFMPNSAVAGATLSHGGSMRPLALLGLAGGVSVCALFSLGRGFEATLAVAQLRWAFQSSRWAALVWGVGALGLLALFGIQRGNAGAWAAEQLAWPLGLLWLWALAAQSASLFALFLCLEIGAALLLLMLCRAHFVVSFSSRAARVSERRGFVAALLILFWTLALSTLFLLWAAAPGASDLNFALGGLSANTASGGYAISVALLLKLLLAPFQLLLVTIYRHLTLFELAHYTLFYYAYLLPLGLGFFFSAFLGISAIGLSLTALAAVCAPAAVFGLVEGAADARITLALSTLVSMSMLLLGILAGLGGKI